MVASYHTLEAGDVFQKLRRVLFGQGNQCAQAAEEAVTWHRTEDSKRKGGSLRNYFRCCPIRVLALLNLFVCKLTHHSIAFWILVAGFWGVMFHVVVIPLSDSILVRFQA